MLHHLSPLRGSRRSALALFALLVHASAESEPKDQPAPKPDFEPLIVSALQVPRDPATVTSAVTKLDPVELLNHGVFQLRDALNQAPGVISLSTSGQTGAVSSLFIRGTTTKYAQIVVDGMRLSNSNNQLGNILSGARTYNVAGIEVLRGPQGAVYGGESVGGVLWLETPYGSGAQRVSTTVEAGSFNSFASYGTFQGQADSLSYYLAGGYEETDNDAPHNHFRQGDTAMRVESKVNSVWTLGTTFRARDSAGEDLDTLYSYDSESEVQNALSTVYAVGRISDRWTARFRAGYYQEFYSQDYSYDDWMSGLPVRDHFFTDLHAGSFTTDHEITLAENLRLLAGAFVYGDTYESTYSPDQNGNRYGAHSTLEWDALENLTTTASLRWEDYDTFGDEFTWRLGTIYHLSCTGTSFRGGVGTSFRAPTYMELYGSSSSPGNAALQAESSIGWDVGIEQKIGAHHTLELTWFQNNISDQITYASFYSPPGNEDGVSITNGLEIGLRGNWLDSALGYRVAWTYLHDSLESAGQPRNAGTASLDWKPTDKSLVGIGATYLSDHSWSGTPLGSSTVARIYGSYQVCDRVKLHARLENAFDENYLLFNGFGSVVQGPGTGLYAGLTIDW